MACNCKKNTMRNTRVYRNRSGNIIRPVTGPQSAQGGPAAAPTPTALRGAAPPTPTRSLAGENQERRKTQKIRRDAILRSFKK